MLGGRVGQHEGVRPFGAGIPDRSDSDTDLFDAATGEYREFIL